MNRKPHRKLPYRGTQRVVASDADRRPDVLAAHEARIAAHAARVFRDLHGAVKRGVQKRESFPVFVKHGNDRPCSGVAWHKATGKYWAYRPLGGSRRKSLGYFKTKAEAERAVQRDKSQQLKHHLVSLIAQDSGLCYTEAS